MMSHQSFAEAEQQHATSASIKSQSIVPLFNPLFVHNIQLSIRKDIIII